MIRYSKDLSDVDVSGWVQSGGTGLSEKRDLREALTLAQILDAVTKKDVARALDILVMRVQALQRAKAVKGGDWDKAAKLELIPEPGSELLPAGLLSLA